MKKKTSKDITPSAAAELKAQMEANQIAPGTTIRAVEPTPFEDEDKIQPALDAIREYGSATISILQRILGLGYGAASRVMDELERRGHVGPSKGAEPREILNLNTAGEVVDTITITAGDVTVKTSSKKLKKLADQVENAKAAGRKPKQTDMVTEGKLAVPEPTSPLYIAGKRLATAVEDENDIKEEKAEAIQDVIKAMRSAKRYNYKVQGYTFELQHFGAQDKVKVIKPK